MVCRAEQAETALAAKDAQIKKLVAFYDKHVGTPCEQIRHQQELEAKDQELARLKVALSGSQDELFKAMAKVREQDYQLDTLLGEAVWAMELVERTYCELEHTQELTIEGNLDAYKRAVSFRRRPDVREWQERQEVNKSMDKSKGLSPCGHFNCDGDHV